MGGGRGIRGNGLFSAVGPQVRGDVCKGVSSGERNNGNAVHCVTDNTQILCLLSSNEDQWQREREGEKVALSLT